MRVRRAHIENFRCLRDLQVSFDDLTVLVGANSTGKSSVLHALSWFFDGGPLEEEDVNGHQQDERVSVGVTFTEFADSDREALGSYVIGDEATLWRTWKLGEKDKLTAKGRTYPGFSAVRQHTAATPKRDAYKELRELQPELDLSSANSAAAVDAALEEWESNHPDELTDDRIDATHLFGFTGQARLAGRMDFVLVPAVIDTDAQTTDARGTMLRQLLDRSLSQQGQMRDRLSELETTFSEQVHAIMTEDGGAELDRLSKEVTSRLAEFVPDRQISLAAMTPHISAPSLSVALRVMDGELDTAVSYQGHGFQRALLIAMVQQLAVQQADEDEEAGGDGDAVAPSSPALFLAIEEPELYQHPLQARHFANTLASIAASPESTVQVAYATHSEHFVDPRHYQRLRRFQRLPDVEWPQSAVTQATIEKVAERLSGLFEPDQIELRIKMTLRRKLAEAVFAKAVLLVEGETDAGVLQGVADRTQGLDAQGIAVVEGGGKTRLAIPWAILAELGVPTYVVFDGDSGLAARMEADGKSEADVTNAVQKNQRENEDLMAALGLTLTLQPTTEAQEEVATFADNLEAELAIWQGFADAAHEARGAQGAWHEKTYDVYREAAATVAADPPAIFAQIMNTASRFAA